MMRGFHTYIMDRRERHKIGVITLIKNHIPAKKIAANTEGHAEIMGVDIRVMNQHIIIYNMYCPRDRELSLSTMDIPEENCMVVGYFNSHLQCKGHKEEDRRGDEVEDWQIDSKLQLQNTAYDHLTYFSRRWKTTSSPDLAYTTDNLYTKSK